MTWLLLLLSTGATLVTGDDDQLEPHLSRIESVMDLVPKLHFFTEPRTPTDPRLGFITVSGNGAASTTYNSTSLQGLTYPHN